ncbi:MAG: hypothetical protein KDB21_00295 [Acidimicrobiales bacterium]|nr:hypothetical protein [Acidimicrobiales bacterium]
MRQRYETVLVEREQGSVPAVGGELLVRIVLAIAASAVVVSVVTLPGYGIVAMLISNLVFVAVGVLITRRQPDNLVGPLAMVHGGGIMALVALSQVGLRLSDNGSTEAAGAVALIVATLFPVIAMLQVPIFLAFPDRTRLTTAARWYLSLVALVVVGMTVVAFLTRPVLVVDPDRVLPHPFVSEPLAGDLVPVNENLVFLIPLLALALYPVLFLRWRCGDGVQRRQIGWLALATFSYLIVASVNTVLQPPDAVGGQTFLLVDAVGFAAIPMALGVAILRFRLYDIDAIVSKTALFLGLAGVITVVYAVVVAGSIAVVGAPSDGLGVVPPVVATAVVAVLFEPVRLRMQRWANRLVFGERATRHEVLSQVAGALADRSAGNSADELAALLVRGTGADQAVVWATDSDGWRAVGRHPADLESGSFVPARDDLRDWRYIEHRGERRGAVVLAKPANDPVTPADRDLLDDVAAGAGLLLRNLGLTRQLEQRVGDLRVSRRRLVAAQDAERRRLERDLHDGAQQRVVAVAVKLGIARSLAAREEATALVGLIDGLVDDAQHAVDQLRRVAHGIYPPLLATEGLAAVLAAMQTPVEIELRARELGRFDQEVEQTAYFALVETIERLRLAGACEATVDVTEQGSGLRLEVATPSLAAIPDLGAVADRLDAIGGALTVVDGGRSVSGVVPVPHTPPRREVSA